jgi:hypothetical protein
MKRSTVILLTALLLLPAAGWTQLLNGGHGLNYVHSARTIEPGWLTLAAHTRFWGKVGEFQTVQGLEAVTFWDVQGSLVLNYGLSKHIEFAINPIVYQDTHQGKGGYNLPDDIFVSLKFGSYGATGSSLSFGALVASRFPTGKYHNAPFEPYSTDKVSFGLIGLATYSQDPLYPEDATQVFVNLGYWNYNDVGEMLGRGDRRVQRVNSMSQELRYGLGVRIPSDKFDFFAEFFGSAFLQRPPEAAYSREDQLFFAPGVLYKPYRWLSLRFSSDFRLVGTNNSTDYSLVGQIANLPNYPGWRVNLTTKVVLLPSTVYRTSERDILMQKAESRRELFEQIIREQRETESAEKELERIKEERRKAERELERLRRILEGEAKKAQNTREPEVEP